MIDYGKILSQKVLGIKPSGIRRFFDIAAEMEDVISLGVGEPDFKTPWSIRHAGAESLEKGRTWYTANAGLMPLREEICHYLLRRFDLSYDPKEEVLVTVGGSEAIDICIRALIDPGDEILIPEPCFVAYSPMGVLADAKVVPIPTKAEDGFRLTAQQLRDAITPKTKLLVFPFPNNPTGAVMRREHLEEIAQVLRGTDIIVLSDEIYAEMTFGQGRHVSIAELDGMRERTVVVNGFSKAYAMTGWRLGYAAGPAPIIAQMTKIHQFAIMCAPTTSQYAAIYSNPVYAALFQLKLPKIRIRAVGLYCGMYNMSERATAPRKGLQLDYLGKHISPEDPRFQVLESIRENYPPAFIMTGVHDFLRENAEPMCRFLSEKGVPAQWKCYGAEDNEAIGHVFHINICLPEAIQCNDDAAAFFKQYV